MTGSTEDSTSPGALPDALIRRIDSLGLPELKSVLSYVERRIESLRTPIEEEIEANAAGETLEIENHGTYALVRTHPPGLDGAAVNTDRVSLYHVRREPRMDGTDSLHWSYLGDVDAPQQFRCDACGRTFDEDAAVCPHCGGDDISHPAWEE